MTLDELAARSREAVNEDLDGTMTVPTQTIRELVARLQIAESIVIDLARVEISRAIYTGPDVEPDYQECVFCGCNTTISEDHHETCLHRRAVEAKP